MTRLVRNLVIALLAFAAIGCAAHTPALHTPGRSEPGLDRDQLLAIAAAAEQLGDNLRAQQYLLAARRAGADDGKVLPLLFRLYVADGQYRLAIELASDHLRSHPRQSSLRMLLAELYQATDLESHAIEQYQRVLILDPSEARAHFALASLLHEHKRDLALADKHFRAYLELEPDGRRAAEARSMLLKELP